MDYLQQLTLHRRELHKIPEVNRELLDMEKAGMLRIKRKNYEREDIYDADYVIAATNDHQINSDIYSACKCMGITVNVCSDKTKCDFWCKIKACLIIV